MNVVHVALGVVVFGKQAREYARIPFARNSVYKIPDVLTDEQVLFLTEILATGYEVGVLKGRSSPATPSSSSAPARSDYPQPLPHNCFPRVTSSSLTVSRVGGTLR